MVRKPGRAEKRARGNRASRAAEDAYRAGQAGGVGGGERGGPREAIEAGRTLREALIAARRQDAVLANALPDALLETLFDPSAQQGDAQMMIDHTLAAWRGL